MQATHSFRRSDRRQSLHLPRLAAPLSFGLLTHLTQGHDGDRGSDHRGRRKGEAHKSRREGDVASKEGSWVEGSGERGLYRGER